MSKAQSFGFDVLLTLTAVLVFNQLLYLYSISEDSTLLFQRRVENNQALSLGLQFNNTLAFFDSYACNGNTESLAIFNSTITHFLDSYVGNREYLLLANNLVYSSAGVDSVCLEKATPIIFEVDSSCNSVLRFEFSIYTIGEVSSC